MRRLPLSGVYPTRSSFAGNREITEGLLKKFGKVEPIIGMEDPYYYRNKVHAAFGRDRKGNVISGFMRRRVIGSFP